MKIITATMARNISNNFENHVCGSRIKEAMNEILLKAEQGHHMVNISFPNSWTKEMKDTIAMFFVGLDYEVRQYPNAFTIIW